MAPFWWTNHIPDHYLAIWRPVSITYHSQRFSSKLQKVVFYLYEEPTTLKSEYFIGRAYVWFDFILPLFALVFLSQEDGPLEVYA